MELLKSTSKFSKKQIILLSIPVFFSNIAIPLVGMVDTGLMGNLGETKYLAATSVATSVLTMIVWSFGFLRMGTVGIVSQAYGRSDYREIVKTLLRNFIIALAAAFIILIFTPLIKISVAHFFSTSKLKETVSLTLIYYIYLSLFSLSFVHFDVFLLCLSIVLFAIVFFQQVNQFCQKNVVRKKRCFI